MDWLALPKLVVVEGVDGVGKTTLAGRFQKEFGYEYVYPVPSPYDSIRKQVEALKDIEARFAFYFASNVTLQGELRRRFAAGQRIVLDRYIYSTMASHQAMGATVACVDASKFPFIVPGLAILLTCALEARNARIISRGLEKVEYVKKEGPILDETERLLRGYPLQVIDTTNLSEEGVFATARGLLAQSWKEASC